MGTSFSALRAVLLTSLLWLIAVIFVASSVMNVMIAGTSRTGAEKLSLGLATFPQLVSQAWDEAQDRMSGAEAYKYLSVPRRSGDLAAYAPLPSQGEELAGLVVTGDTAQADRGWRVLGGAFSFGDRVDHAAVLIDPDFNIARIWHLDEAALPQGQASENSRKILHGLSVLPGGAIVFSFDHGHSIQRRSLCGELDWINEGIYHHSVNADAEGRTIWAPRFDKYAIAPGAHFDNKINEGFVQIDAETGEILREIPIADIIAANPYSGLLTMPRHDENDVSGNSLDFIGTWNGDPYHFNDVDPLPAALASAYPGFAAGDLLISARDLNTVFVMDPDSLRIKWSRSGATQRQHDPDWQADGTISVFDNRMSRGASQIVALNPGSDMRKVTVDGATIDFHTRIRGKHMRTGRGDIAIVSPQQGRAFDLGADGKPVIEFANLNLAQADKSLVITEYLWLPESALDPKEVSQCRNN